MAVYNVLVQVLVGTTYISNRYLVNCTTFTEAIAAGDQIAPIHAAGLPETFRVTAVRVSTPAQHDGIFSTKSLNIQGGRGQAGQNLPYFNRFLVSFDPGITYKNRKFYPGVTEGDQIDSGVMPATITSINQLYVDPLLELGVLCNKFGVIYTQGTVEPLVCMRQLRRHKRKKKPIIPT